MGAYHSGVEVSGVEWTFAQNGIFFHTPKTPNMAPGQVVKLRESMEMGTHVGSANDVHGVINRCGVVWSSVVVPIVRDHCITGSKNQNRQFIL